MKLRYLVRVSVCVFVCFFLHSICEKNSTKFCITGGTFAHAHMLNAESRKYFNRAYSSSGVVSRFHLRRDNHVEYLRQCLQINETGYGFAEILKTANTTALAECNYLRWIIFIESPNTPGAFITQSLDEIYNSDSAPKVDAMFSIATQVNRCIHFPELIY